VCQLRPSWTPLDPSFLSNATELRARALRHRADLLASLARYEAAQAALQVEIARQYPDVRIGSGYQWDQGESKWTLSASAELPIFNRNQGPIAEAEARRNLRAAETLDAQARASNEIDRALESLAAAEQENMRARETLQALARQSQSVRERLAAGAADQLEVQAAVVEESAAAILAHDAQVRARLAQAQLEAGLQIPSPIMNAVNPTGLALR
jgi:cobalt-zinc-cadmium efflux system outer membrane protein